MFTKVKMSANLPLFDTPKLAEAVEQLPTDQVDQLAFGAIRLDLTGAVTFMSQRERELSGRGDRPSIGLSFFTDIAPCMANPHFKGRIDAALAAGTLDAEFTHVGDFADRDREMRVRAQSAADGGVWLFLKR
jgi:photoactive yellow protein